MPTQNTLDWLAVQRDEASSVARRLSADDMSAFERAMLAANRVFASGSGRTGLALRMATMRMAHLGLIAHVVGDATTPAIRPGDLLVVASGSGATPTPLRAAQVARSVGATVAAVTADAGSPLAQAADLVLLIPAATKQDRSGAASAQYAGALFEQSVLAVFDAIFECSWRGLGQDAEALWQRHANIE